MIEHACRRPSGALASCSMNRANSSVWYFWIDVSFGSFAGSLP